MKKNKPILFHKKGSALLITMLIIATLGAMALAVARINLVELKISTNYADSIVAYYAAGAGLERGLLEYKKNKGYEETNQTVSLSANGSSYSRSIGHTNASGTVLMIENPTEEEKKLPNFVSVPPPKKDQVREFDISNNNTMNLDWDYDQIYDAPPSYENNRGVEIILIKKEWTIAEPTGDPNNPNITRTGSDRKFIAYSASTLPSISLNQGYRLMRVKPIGLSLVRLRLSSTGEKIDRGIANIESTGTYGKTMRKLVAQISRNPYIDPDTNEKIPENQILGIFDYTLYAGDEPGLGRGILPD